MKMTKLRHWIILLAAVICGCAGIPAGTLEFNGLQDFSLQKLEGSNELTLRISGTCASSSLAISRIDIVTKGDKLIVLPRLVLAHEGISGSFDQVLKVPSNIHHVHFGQEGREIWPNIPQSPGKPITQEELQKFLSQPPVNK